jgi:hypothetical protein
VYVRASAGEGEAGVYVFCSCDIDALAARDTLAGFVDKAAIVSFARVTFPQTGSVAQMMSAVLRSIVTEQAGILFPAVALQAAGRFANDINCTANIINTVSVDNAPFYRTPFIPNVSIRPR